MLPLLLHTFTSVCLLTAHVSAVTAETVVGMAGKRVTLPCRAAVARRRGVEVCWGKGEPSLFTCQNTVVNTLGDEVMYRRSYRYSVSSSLSLSILLPRPADSGFYHCRVQLPGLFNDQTSTVHLIVTARSVVSPTTRAPVLSDKNLNAPHATTGFATGSDVTDEKSTGPMVAQVQSSVQQQQLHSLWSFIGNTMRVSFIIFIPALLLTAAYRVWRTKQRSGTDRRLNQSEEEEEEEDSL